PCVPARRNAGLSMKVAELACRKIDRQAVPRDRNASARRGEKKPRRHEPAGQGESKLPVVALLQGIEQVGSGVDLAVVLDFLVALQLDHFAAFQREAIRGVGEVSLLDENALERGRVEPERRAALQALV